MFDLVSKYDPAGDQPNAIKQLSENVINKEKYQVLLGATGTGKTFTIANVIKNTNKNTLVLAHNKVLATQLYEELRAFFPNNRVEYFVSYFDYFQPEAYVPGKDLYIEKDSAVNEEIDRLRHSATAALFEDESVIIVASVSCIYGLGSPDDYKNLALSLRVGQEIKQNDVIYKLIDLQYERNDTNFDRTKFRIRGDVIDVVSAISEKEAYRIEFFGDEIDSISLIDILTGKKIKNLKHMVLFPATHYTIDPSDLEEITEQIRIDMEKEVQQFIDNNQLIEAQRLEQRTKYDLEMIKEIGYCSGIENYTRYFSKKVQGETPFTLLDYFNNDWLLVVDESHVTLPQVRGMYAGDRARKENLVNYGFRLHAALDNRPLMFEEFLGKIDQALFISATPNEYEIELSNNKVVEQIIRPTYLVDPIIEVRPRENQIDDIIKTINETKEFGRTLITTLTKKMAEDLTTYLKERGIKVAYMHSDVATIDRMKIVNSLRAKKYDVLIGINLLREGLDIPEVRNVMILDADKQGFLRSTTALIQTIGRAARNMDGKVIMYAEGISNAMNEAINETNRRRERQIEYNTLNGVKPLSISRDISNNLFDEDALDNILNAKKNKKQKAEVLKELEKEMNKAVADLEFERAAEIRDLIFGLNE